MFIEDSVEQKVFLFQVSSAVFICPVGHEPSEDRSECVPCLEGYFSKQIGIEVCIPCRTDCSNVVEPCTQNSDVICEGKLYIRQSNILFRIKHINVINN